MGSDGCLQVLLRVSGAIGVIRCGAFQVSGIALRFRSCQVRLYQVRRASGIEWSCDYRSQVCICVQVAYSRCDVLFRLHIVCMIMSGCNGHA